MQMLRAAAYQCMPWKNGGGETFEIAVSPPHATFDTLDWRISMARVAQDGPFSMLPGIERTLCVLDGPGLDLDFGTDAAVQRLTTASAPFRFAADRALYARTLGAPITDLNVMTRHARYQHKVQRFAIDPARTFTSDADQLLVFCEHGNVLLTMTGESEQLLGTRDGAVFDARDVHDRLTLATVDGPAASIFLIELYRVTAQSR